MTLTRKSGLGKIHRRKARARSLYRVHENYFALLAARVDDTVPKRDLELLGYGPSPQDQTLLQALQLFSPYTDDGPPGVEVYDLETR